MTEHDPATDSDAPSAQAPADNAPAANAEATPAEQPGRSKSALWVLVVVGCFLALGALWFAFFGSPRRIGPDVGTRPVQSKTATPTVSSVASSAAKPTTATLVPITVADVNAVLGQIDYIESNDASTTEYDTMVTHALAGVDLAAFAQSTLEATSAIMWQDVGWTRPLRTTGALKRAIVARSVAYWIASRDASGTDAPPLAAVLGVRMYPPANVDRNIQDSYFEVMAQGLGPLGLMFGAHDIDNEWTWKVVGVSITGTETANVTYTVRSFKGVRWKFINRKARYTKQLRFSRTPDGVWKLSAWLNYANVNAKLQSNVKPPGAATPVDEWWGTL